MSQALDLFGQPVGIERFHGLNDACVQHPAPLVQKTTIGHLVGEGVLKGIFEFGEEASFVEEFSSL